MCGIAGYYTQRYRDHESRLRELLAPLQRRGPDDEGVWMEGAMALGHRRLAIQDPTPAGRQPMLSKCGRYVIAYNGEVYNYLEMRAEIDGDGIAWDGHSDTEVILEYIARKGLDAFLDAARGMFAFALYDRATEEVTLVRDRMGIKPLFYGTSSGRLFFASEIKSFDHGFQKALNGGLDIDVAALSSLLRFSYITGRRTIYRGVWRVQPGEVVKIRQKGVEITCSRHRFWSLEERRCTALRAEKEHVERLQEVLSESVRLHMRADVPYGAFLSGGIDSSLIVALMVETGAGRIKTFSLGFDGDGYDEAPEARKVAAYLGTDHTECYVEAKDALNVIPELPAIYDEPFADSSQIPTYLVSRLARENVTVCLSGDGADELFGGYDKYRAYGRVLRSLSVVPRRVRRAVQPGVGRLVDSAFGKVIGDHLPFRNGQDKLGKLSRMLPLEPAAAYLVMDSLWHNVEEVVLGDPEELPRLEDYIAAWRSGEPDGQLEEGLLLQDQVQYLPDDILCKLDRASMHVGLEARVPFLDAPVVEFARSLPLMHKIRGAVGKWILKELLRRYLPEELFRRPKMGFRIPIDAWLRGPLRDWAEAYLSREKLGEVGCLKVEPIRRKWEAHLSGHGAYGYWLWSVLMFITWHDARWGKGGRQAAG